MLFQLENYSRNYGHHRSVLTGINISIDVGQIVCVMGPNGAGKTSLIEAILSHHRPTDAYLYYKDSQISNLTSHQAFTSQCGYIGHEPGLIYDLTALENLEYFADFHCVKPPSRSHLIQLLDKVGLANRSNDRARTFSRGMRQRLSIARSLVHSPSLLLYDEPLTGLDTNGIQLLVALLQQFKTNNSSALIVTHDDRPFQSIADRYLFIKAGQLIADIDASRYNQKSKLAVQELINKA